MKLESRSEIVLHQTHDGRTHMQVTSAADFQIHPERRRKMEAFRARAESLKEKARQRAAFRESESYHQAACLLKEEFTASDALPEMRSAISFEAADGLATE